MILADGALGVILLGVWLFCLIDVITADESQMRNLPKLAWVFIVLLLVDLGALVWLIAGRNWDSKAAPRGRAHPRNPDDDEEFLRSVRERADQQRRQHEARRTRELDAEKDQLLRRPQDEV